MRFFASDQVDDLHIGVCRALDVLIHLLDDEFGFHEVGVVESLTIDPLQRVVRQCCRKCCLLLLVSRARNADRVDVRRDQEIRPFKLPCFEVVAVLLDVELRCLANNLRDATVALGEFPGKDLSFSSFVVESFFHLSHLVVHDGLHHHPLILVLHLQQFSNRGVNAFRDHQWWNLLYVCGSVFVDVVGVFAIDFVVTAIYVVFAAVVDDVLDVVFIVEVESDVVFIGCHLDW